MSLLSVEELSVTFTARGRKDATAVDGVSFAVDQGQVVGLVGESGCGKSVTSLALMGLLPRKGVRVGGRAEFDGQNLLTMNERKLRDMRGSQLAMIFQDPLSSLNPAAASTPSPSSADAGADVCEQSGAWACPWLCSCVCSCSCPGAGSRRGAGLSACWSSRA